MNKFLGKGWRYPVEIDRAGGVAYSEHEESIRQAILIILGTAPGERVMRPQFGCDIHELLYAPNTQSTATLAAFYCSEALHKWEPRVTGVEAEGRPSREEPNRLDITIRYRVRSTNVPRNLVFPFYTRTGNPT